TGTLATDILVSAAQPWITAAVLIKTASMPLHYWLIESYTAVSPGVATLLSGFATKVGVLTAARLVRFTPLDLPVLAYAGAGIAVIAVLFAVFQHNARRLLSYHIVSQVGYMTAGIGLAAASSAADHAAALAVTAGLFHLVSNTLYKSLLFMTAAAAYRSFGHENLLHMGGLARRRPVLFVCSLIGAGAIAGVPFTIGYASKELLKTAAGNTPIAIILTIAGIGTGVSFIKFIYLIFLAPGSTGAAPLHTGNSRTHRELLYMLPTVLLSAIVLVLGFAPGILPGIPTMDFFTLPAIGKATLPLAAAAGLWLLAKGHLTKPGRTGTKTEVESSRLQSPRTAWLTQHTWPLRHLARVVHALDPQIQMIVLLAAVTGLTLMLL
ncbi:MAG: proton-conducting transporter membrane subunit, partial [Spirochaeta sp.]